MIFSYLHIWVVLYELCLINNWVDGLKKKVLNDRKIYMQIWILQQTYICYCNLQLPWLVIIHISLLYKIFYEYFVMGVTLNYWHPFKKMGQKVVNLDDSNVWGQPLHNFFSKYVYPNPTKRHYVMPPFVKVHTYLQTSNSIGILLRMPKEWPCHWMWQLDYDKIGDGPFQRFPWCVVGRPKIYSNTQRPHVQLCSKSPSTWEWPSRPSLARVQNRFMLHVAWIDMRCNYHHFGMGTNVWKDNDILWATFT